MSHDAYDSLAAVYAVGALDGDELAQFEAHLAGGCDHCEAALRESREALARLTLDEPRAIPPTDVKDALLRRIAIEPVRAGAPSRPPERRRWVPWAAATAAAAVISAMLTGGFVASRYEAQLGVMAREVTRIRDEIRRRDVALLDEIATYRGVVELLADPATRVVDLRGQGPNAEAAGRVVWHERAGGYLIATKLPPLPAGKAYEAWLLGGPAPRPAGVFTVDASGQGSRKLDPAAGAPTKGFAVTVESEAGTSEPTGPIVLASR
jgi:anti-sigma-K factor RskA